MSPLAHAVAEKGQSTRRRIIEAAVDVFGRYGYHGASLAEIASQAGVGRPGLLHHFKSKEQLLTAVLDEHYPGDGNPALPDGTGAAAVTAMIMDVTRRNGENPELVRFFAVLQGEALTENHPAAAWYAARFRRLRERLTELLAQSGENAERRDEYRQLITVALAAMDGLQMQWLRDPAGLDLDQSVRLVAEFIGTRSRALAGTQPASPSTKSTSR